jgi:hypothetical protein
MDKEGGREMRVKYEAMETKCIKWDEQRHGSEKEEKD